MCCDGLSALSDVSRISDISITAYLRNVSPNARPDQGDENANMGNSDLCLGSVRFTPNLESMQPVDEWLQLSPGNGAIHMQMAFKPNQNQHLTIDSFELLKVIGKGSFGKVSPIL